MKDPSRKSGFFKERFEELESTWRHLRERTLKDPSRTRLHQFRRSCRKWQGILEIMGEGGPGPSCRRIIKDLSRCLRRSRGLRNADVIQKFLLKNHLGLKLSFSRKKEARSFCRFLHGIGPGKQDDLRKCLGFLDSQAGGSKLSSALDPASRRIEAFRELDRAFQQWSNDPKNDFSPLHKLRIRLKKIAAQEAFLGNFAGRLVTIPAKGSNDLKRILRLLGRMSDLTLLAESLPKLKGKRSERVRMEKILLELRTETGKRIRRLLWKSSGATDQGG